MSDFWGKRKNPVKTGKRTLILKLSTAIHNLSTKPTELWRTLWKTCGEAEDNPKTGHAGAQRPKPPKSLWRFGFWGIESPKENMRAAVESPKVEKLLLGVGKTRGYVGTLSQPLPET